MIFLSPLVLSYYKKHVQILSVESLLSEPSLACEILIETMERHGKSDQSLQSRRRLIQYHSIYCSNQVIYVENLALAGDH